MSVNVDYYKKLILETLYRGFLSNPPNKIDNDDADNAFGKIDDNTNFKIARERLIQDGLIYGKNVNYGNPPYFMITGEGLIFYEKNYIIPSVKREYTLLASKMLTFLRDVGNKKYNISKYYNSKDKRIIQVKLPRKFINQIMIDDYYYKMNGLKWLLLFFTSRFVSKHIMEINGKVLVMNLYHSTTQILFV